MLKAGRHQFVQRIFRVGYHTASSFVEELYASGAMSEIEQDGFRTSLVRRVSGPGGVRRWVVRQECSVQFDVAVGRQDWVLVSSFGQLLSPSEELA